MYIFYVVCLLHAFSATYQLSLKMFLNLDICTVLKFIFSEWEACLAHLKIYFCVFYHNNVRQNIQPGTTLSGIVHHLVSFFYDVFLLIESHVL